ncbi:MAG: hypothetical protein OEZ02_05240 [Anaerolineae bacterium]|nr:hypothetical protein [Anaerolineae bacterium]
MQSKSYRRSQRKLWLISGLVVYLWAALISLVLRVSSVDGEGYHGQIGPDVEAQLIHVSRRVHTRDVTGWKVMMSHTFYGFSLVNTVLLEPDNQERRAEAIGELEWVLRRLESPEIAGKYKDTQVPHGVYYLGERNLTLAGLMLIDPNPKAKYKAEFHQTSQALFEAFMESPAANLDTYPGHAWPTDNVPALYSLALHDRLYGSHYQTAIDRWVAFMAANLDETTGLMPAKIDYRSGDILNVPRGVALSFTFIFLKDLAPEFAAEQYALYQQQFFKSTLGFAGIREYPPGISRPADVDSGPIIREVGAGATGLGIVAAKAMGDAESFESILQLSEIIGFPMQVSEDKYYLFGRLLIGDEIILWGKTYTSWLTYLDGRHPDRLLQQPKEPIFTLAYFYWIAGTVGIVLIWKTLWLVRKLQNS